MLDLLLDAIRNKMLVRSYLGFCAFKCRLDEAIGNFLSSLLAGILRRLLSGWARDITTTFVSMTLKKGLTMPGVLLGTMRPLVSMTFQLV